MDCHKMTREGIVNYFKGSNSIKVLGHGNVSVDFYNSLIDSGSIYSNCDVIVFSISTCDRFEINILSKLVMNKRDVKYIVLNSHESKDDFVRIISSDIDGYLLKFSSLSELEAAIKSVSRNEKYIQSSYIPEYNKVMIQKNDDLEKIKTLTNREKEILILIAKGNSNRSIAEILFISERTVKNHISNIFRKIDVDDRTQAAVLAIKNSLINI